MLRSTKLDSEIDLAMKQIEKAEQLDSETVFEGLDIAYFKPGLLEIRDLSRMLAGQKSIGNIESEEGHRVV